MPVRVEKTCQNNNLVPGSDSIRAEKTLPLLSSRSPLGVNQRVCCSKQPGPASLDSRNEIRTLFFICSHFEGSRTMLRMFVEEAAALASITLFVAMIAVWAQVIPQL